MDDMFSGLGGARVDHCAIEVVNQPGNLDQAGELLQKLGFYEVTERRISGDWGDSRFYQGTGYVLVQLTQPSSSDQFRSNETHLAISVLDPKRVTEQILEWANDPEMTDSEIATSELVGQGTSKYFVYLWRLFTCPLEIVPSRKSAW